MNGTARRLLNENSPRSLYWTSFSAGTKGRGVYHEERTALLVKTYRPQMPNSAPFVTHVSIQHSHRSKSP